MNAIAIAFLFTTLLAAGAPAVAQEEDTVQMPEVQTKPTERDVYATAHEASERAAQGVDLDAELEALGKRIEQTVDEFRGTLRALHEERAAAQKPSPEPAPFRPGLRYAEAPEREALEAMRRELDTLRGRVDRLERELAGLRRPKESKSR